MSTRYTPEPSQIDYHSEIRERRVQRVLSQLDPGDVLSIIDSRIASEADPAQHPLYQKRLVVYLQAADHSTSTKTR